jgi:hypothetical protein
MLAEPFDPFTMMIERPIPRETPSTIPTVEKELEEEGELEKTIVSIQKDKEIDREEILERLRKNKIWITYCDIPLSYTQDSQYISDYELEKEDYYSDSESDSDDASANLESDTDKDSSEEEESEIASLEEEYDLETATKNLEFDEDIIFVICSEAKLEKPPGKGSVNEKLPDNKNRILFPDYHNIRIGERNYVILLLPKIH